MATEEGVAVSALGEAVISTGKQTADLISTIGTYCAYTEEGEPVVNVCSIRKISAPALRLLVNEPGRRARITALHIGTLLGNSKGFEVLVEKKIFAATSRSIHTWDIEDCYAAHERGIETDSVPLSIPSGCHVTHIKTDTNLKWLAVTSDTEVLIFNLQEKVLSMRLDGHSLQVNAVEFDAHACEHLVTASDDRTFKVWDLERKELVYQSSIYGAAPLSCLAIDPTFPRMAIGSTDGLIRFFDLMSPAYPLIQSLDLPLAVKRKFGDPVDQDQQLQAPEQAVHVISNNKTKMAHGAGKWKQESIGMGCIASVSSLYYIRTERSQSNSSELLPTSPKVVACTTQMLVVIDAYTYEIVTIIPFSNYSYRNCPTLEIDTPRLFSADNRSCGCATLCIASAFTPQINVVKIVHEQEKGANVMIESSRGMGGSYSYAAIDEQPEISVFPSSPPKHLSKLYQAIDKENSNVSSVSSYESVSGRKLSLTSKRRLGGDKPVTFHSRVKSSGYGKIEPLKFLGRQVQSRTQPKKTKNNLKTARLLKSYPVDCEPVHKFQNHHILDNDEMVHSAPILRVRFCPDGSRIATASVDKSLRTLKVPLAKHRGDGESFLGHGGPVLDASWNHTGNLILTGSSDRTACLWSVKKSQALLQIKGICTEKRKKVVKEFNADVKAVKFFHLDRLLVLACMNKLHFFKYDLGPKKTVDDIARLHQLNTCSHILELSTNSQSVSDFDSHNGFISNLLIAGTSAKSIEVFDADAGAVVRSMENAHSRAIHRIVVNPTTPYVSHDKSAHDLFLSAASDSSIKLWDLRSPRGSVRCFAGHLNRQNPIGVHFSPCMKYIACGSEDKTVYLYDIRMGTILNKLRNGVHDVVGDVCFHPMYPQLVAATYDGKLRFFSSSS